MPTKIASLGLPGDIGDVKMTVRATAQPNWLLCIGETIGNATSGADYAGSEYEPLFDLLNVADRWGNDGTAVFADGDTVLLPNVAGIGVTGAGTQNINARAKGGNSLGETVEDAAQQITGAVNMAGSVNLAGSGAFSTSAGASNTDVTPAASATTVNLLFDNANSSGARTGSETTISSAVFNFIIRYQ